MVQQLSAQFDVWWDGLEGSLVNERAVGPRINPFKEQFWHQFGGEASSEDLRLMDMSQNPATRAPGTPLDFVPTKWRPYVLPSENCIDRHYFELCVMTQLQVAMQRRDTCFDFRNDPCVTAKQIRGLIALLPENPA